VFFLSTNKKKGGHWGTGGEGKVPHLPRYDNFMRTMCVIQGPVEMLLPPLVSFSKKYYILSKPSQYIERTNRARMEYNS
jgi:hypothetical protein